MHAGDADCLLHRTFLLIGPEFVANIILVSVSCNLIVFGSSMSAFVKSNNVILTCFSVERKFIESDKTSVFCLCLSTATFSFTHHGDDGHCLGRLGLYLKSTLAMNMDGVLFLFLQLDSVQSEFCQGEYLH